MSDRKETQGDEPERFRQVRPGGVVRLGLEAPPEGSKRTTVDIRAVRVKDLRDLSKLDLDTMTITDAVAWLAERFTDLAADEIEEMAITDLAAIKEEIDEQTGKLAGG